MTVPDPRNRLLEAIRSDPAEKSMVDRSEVLAVARTCERTVPTNPWVWVRLTDNTSYLVP